MPSGVVPAAPARRGLERLPVLDPPDPRARERLRLLPDDDHPRLPDRGRQPPQRVQERAEVGLLHVVRERVQARVHRRVGRLEHAQHRLARGAQQRRVRPVVELDLVRGHPRGLAQGTAGRSGGDSQAGYGHGLTLAHDRRRPRRLPPRTNAHDDPRPFLPPPRRPTDATRSRRRRSRQVRAARGAADDGKRTNRSTAEAAASRGALDPARSPAPDRARAAPGLTREPTNAPPRGARAPALPRATRPDAAQALR